MNESLKQYGTLVPTPQSQPIPGKQQVKNSAGGFVYAIDKWTRLHRWLILGSEGGSYYASERTLTFQNLDTVRECIAEDGRRVVSVICDISVAGRAPKNDPALFGLAMCASLGDDATRRAAFDALPEVARIGTHLFQFISYVEQFRRWGRGLRSAVARWYTEKDADKLALQLVKYRQREGWTHRDALRKAHSTRDAMGPTAALLEWATLKPGNELNSFYREALPALVVGFEKVQKAKTPREAAEIVRSYNLPWEAVPTELLNTREVREALLPGMPINALVRQLGVLTRTGLLTNTSNATQLVLSKLADAEAVQKSRIHPINVLIAMKTYGSGGGLRSSNTWAPQHRIVDALDDLFYASFGNVEASGKRRLIGLDVSGSMGMDNINDVPGLTPRVASAAMAMVTMKTGDPYEVVAFTGGSGGWGFRSRYEQNTESLSVLPLSGRQRLDDIVARVSGLPFGGTDCSLPMLWATKHRKEFDAFEIYTDNETWAGDIHPSQALAQYRQASGIPAKLVVYGMTSSGFSIADPADPGMMDVVGFDSATPAIVDAFLRGEI